MKKNFSVIMSIVIIVHVFCSVWQVSGILWWWLCSVFTS